MPTAQRALDHDLLFRGVTSIAEVAPRVLRFSYGESGTPAKLGVVFQLRSQPRDTPGGFIWEATDSVVADLNVGYLYGFGIIAQMTNGVMVSGLRFRAPADSWRTTAGFADPINVHGTYVQLDAKNGVQARFRYMQVDALGFPQFHPGDEIVLVAGRCCARGGSAQRSMWGSTASWASPMRTAGTPWGCVAASPSSNAG